MTFQHSLLQVQCANQPYIPRASSQRGSLHHEVYEAPKFRECRTLRAPSSISTTRQSPGSAPSIAIGPDRLWIFVRSTFLMSSLSSKNQLHCASKVLNLYPHCHCSRSGHQSNLGSMSSSVCNVRKHSCGPTDALNLEDLGIRMRSRHVV